MAYEQCVPLILVLLTFLIMLNGIFTVALIHVADLDCIFTKGEIPIAPEKFLPTNYRERAKIER